MDTTPTVASAAPAGSVLAQLPQRSLGGNLLGLGVNLVAAWWTWKRGGWWRVLAAGAAVNSLYFIRKIEKQV